MDKSKLYKILKYILAAVLIFIVLCFLLQVYRVKIYDKKPVKVTASREDSGVTVDVSDPSYADSWSTVITEANGSKQYTGTTYSVDVVNGLNHAIRDWQLKIVINEKCYLNGFWCGEFDVHQIRDGRETVERVNSADYDPSASKLDHNTYTDSMMIELQPGDYLVYYPSAAVGETYVAGNSSKSIGMILYSADMLKLSWSSITYYNERKITEGAFFSFILIMTVVFLLASAIVGVSYFTYKSTKKDVDSLSQSVIDGLSREYKSLWHINIRRKSIQLVRSLDEDEVKNAVEAAGKFTDYDESIRYYVDHYVDEKDRERVWKEVNFDTMFAHVKEEKFLVINYVQLSPEMSRVYFQMVFTGTQDSDGTEGIVMAFRDVDRNTREEQIRKEQLENALAAAEQANRTKSEFLANMSHEIRTPINAVLGMDTMILRESTEQNVREYAKDIKTAGDTLLGLINDILDFSKIESGRMELVPVDYQLDSVLSDLMNMIRPKAEDKGLEIELVLDPETPAKLHGDEIRVKQIILNLLNNAVKYTKKGKITWTVDYKMSGPDACELHVSVKDTGIGIKPEDIERLFSPYERLERSRNRTIEGTGLGLSIVKNLLEKMDSRLEVESVYGEGSDFSFRIIQPMWGTEPIGDHLTEVSFEEETEEKFHAPEAKLLVVDDVEMNLMVIKGLLKRIQVQPDVCLSGKEGLELAKKNRYDIIFLDAMMPEMSGEETLKHIKEEAEINKDTPVIVLTANAIVGAKEEYLAAGFSNYLSKPVGGRQLEDMICSYLPDEKIILPGPDGFASAGVLDEKKAEDPVISALRSVRGINVDEGIKASGGEDIYAGICGNFKDTAKGRMQMIKDLFEAHDIENYAIQVHALKSSARLIGAGDLSALAFEMEKAGRNGSWEPIEQNTEKLLDDYNSIYNELKSVFEKAGAEEKSAAPGKELTPKKLKRILSDIRELVSAYDLESAKEVMNSLKEYAIPEAFESTYDRLKTGMAEVDYDSIAKIIDEYFSEGGN